MNRLSYDKKTTDQQSQKSRILVALFLLFSNAVTAEEWQLASDKDGVQVYIRGTASGFNEARATMTIDASMQRLVSIYSDPDGYCDWFSSCVESRRVDDSSGYIRIDVPIPLIADRDAVVETKMIEDGTDQVVFEGRLVQTLPEVDGVVRMPTLQNRWSFRALDENKTQVEMYQRMEPGGRMPKFGFNQSIKRSPHKTLIGLAELAEQK